jgi:hypothetical protein
VYIGSDHLSVVPDGARGRKSIRITSKYITSGNVLILIDLDHMPSSTSYLPDGCAVWPAFWTCGPDWPNNGEIDIIEYANKQATDLTTLHTNANCSQADEDISSFSGVWSTNIYGEPATNCDVGASDQWSNQGCGIYGNTAVNQQFNNNEGGIYALEWVQNSEIRSFFFQRNSIPSDISSKTPNPESWGKPYARFEISEASDCNSNHFSAHNIIFDLTFCGDWAGATFSSDCTASESCESFVKYNPQFFENSFWLINYVDIYDIL